MKKYAYTLLALLTCFVLSSCAGTKVQNTSFDPNDECPDDEPCLHYSTEGTTPQSTTVQKTTAIIQKKNNKVVDVTPLYNGQATDRATNLIDNTFGLAGSIGSAAIERDGVVSAAKHLADGTVKAAEIKAKGGPETVINNNVKGGTGIGGAAHAETGPNNLSATQAQTSTNSVGVALNQTQQSPQ